MKAGLTERRLIQTNQPETAGEEDFMKLILGIILIVASLFLIIAVLMQSSKSHRLSGTIAGGAETFFGKSKGSTIDKKLSKLTTVVAIVFVVLVLAVYLLQDTAEPVEVDPAPIVAGDIAETGETTDGTTEATGDETTGAETTEATTAGE